MKRKQATVEKEVTNPLHGKFDEMVNAVLGGGRVRFPAGKSQTNG